MNDIITELKNYWEISGVNFRQPASMNSLRDFEVHYNVAIPADIAQYFITFDGLENGESDTDMISLWPLGKIRKVRFSKNSGGKAHRIVEGESLDHNIS